MGYLFCIHDFRMGACKMPNQLAHSILSDSVCAWIDWPICQSNISTNSFFDFCSNFDHFSFQIKRTIADRIARRVSSIFVTPARCRYRWRDYMISRWEISHKRNGKSAQMQRQNPTQQASLTIRCVCVSWGLRSVPNRNALAFFSCIPLRVVDHEQSYFVHFQFIICECNLRRRIQMDEFRMRSKWWLTFALWAPESVRCEPDPYWLWQSRMNWTFVGRTVIICIGLKYAICWMNA